MRTQRSTSRRVSLRGVDGAHFRGRLRHFLAAALALASLLALAAACGGSSESTGARLMMDGDSFDVGTVAVGETVERTVEFRNEGPEPLAVSIVKVRPAPDSDCGCGVEAFEVRPETVPPGGTGELVFTLRVPEGMENSVDRMTVELESNDSSDPERTITLIFSMAPSADREG